MFGAWKILQRLCPMLFLQSAAVTKKRIGNSSAQVNLFPAIFGAQVNLFPAIFVSTRALSHFACVLLSSKRKSGIVLLG